jgi:hypothetical protein
MGLGVELIVGIHRSRDQSAATDRIRPLRGARLTCGCVIMLCQPQLYTVLLKRAGFSILTSGNNAFGPLGQRASGDASRTTHPGDRPLQSRPGDRVGRGLRWLSSADGESRISK